MGVVVGVVASTMTEIGDSDNMKTSGRIRLI